MAIFLAPGDGSGMVDASTMLGHVISTFPGVVKLVNVFTSLAALAITYIGLFKFTSVKPRGETKLITPILYVLVGAALFNLASSLQTILVTIFGAGADVHNLMAYQSESGVPDASRKLIQVLVMCARLYGLVAAIRGIMVLRHVGDPNYRNGNAFSNGCMRLIFGCLLLNLVQTVNVVAMTFGWGRPLG